MINQHRTSLPTLQPHYTLPLTSMQQLRMPPGVLISVVFHCKGPMEHWHLSCPLGPTSVNAVANHWQFYVIIVKQFWCEQFLSCVNMPIHAEHDTVKANPSVCHTLVLYHNKCRHSLHHLVRAWLVFSSATAMMNYDGKTTNLLCIGTW